MHLTMEHEISYIIVTPLGFSVRVTINSWNIITTVKHPVMAGYEEKINRSSRTLMKYGPA